jgi:hypothetical protein
MEQKIINEMINIDEPILVDNSIQSFKYLDYIPQNLADINYDNAQINIDIQASDNFLVPSESQILIEGQLLRDDDQPFGANDEITLVNNAMMYMFRYVELEVGTEKVESIDNPGQTTSILGYLSYPDDFNSSSGMSLCWSKDTTDNANSQKYNTLQAVGVGGAVPAFTPQEIATYNEGFHKRKLFLNSSNPRGLFSFCIPFSHIFGFSEYGKYIYNTKMSLKFSRESDNIPIHKTNTLNRTGKIRLNKITWRIPEIQMAPEDRTNAINKIVNGKDIPVSYTRRTCYKKELVANVTSDLWRTSVTSGVDKPRWVIVAFQTNRHTDQNQNPAVFDNVDLREACLELNSEKYPKDSITIDFNRNDIARWYNSLDKFKKEYYGYNSLIGGTQITPLSFKNMFPFIVFDVRRQSEQLRSGVADMTLKFKFGAGVPANTHVYAIVLSDSLYYMSADGQRMILQRK